ncbi:GMC family oxidoreductase [Martelella sp. FOR1707]
MEVELEPDYIIIGAGAAGCVLADRLSADLKSAVLVLEAGGTDRRAMSRIPAGFYYLLRDPSVDWGYQTAPEPGLDGRRLPYPRGKILGGSGTINGLWQSRGLPSDYDRWAEIAGSDWSYAAMLPYFRMSEAFSGGDPSRGTDGPITVETSEVHSLTARFFEAGRNLQLPFIEDYNATPGSGLARIQQTRRGRFRETAATGYLRRARKRANVRLQKQVLVTRLLFEGLRVSGVELRKADGTLETVRARREVILSAGAINSPHLLHRSGIGPADALASAGIAPRVDRRDVGANLHDHYNVRVIARIEKGASLNREARFPRVAAHALRYLLTGRGILTYSAANGTGFVKSTPAEAEPDLQFVFTPASYSPEGGGRLDRFAGITCSTWLMRPKSRGRLRTVSADPDIPPQFHLGFMTDPDDTARLLAGMRWNRRLLESAFGANATEVRPGADCTDDGGLVDYMKRTGATVFHPVGSCRMGRDQHAVVDPRLRVNGVAGLRVVDASVMPTVPSSNTHAPVVAIAEKAAEMILADRDAGAPSSDTVAIEKEVSNG